MRIYKENNYPFRTKHIFYQSEDGEFYGEGRVVISRNNKGNIVFKAAMNTPGGMEPYRTFKTVDSLLDNLIKITNYKSLYKNMDEDNISRYEKEIKSQPWFKQLEKDLRLAFESDEEVLSDKEIFSITGNISKTLKSNLIKRFDNSGIPYKKKDGASLNISQPEGWRRGKFKGYISIYYEIYDPSIVGKEIFKDVKSIVEKEVEEISSDNFNLRIRKTEVNDDDYGTYMYFSVITDLSNEIIE